MHVHKKINGKKEDGKTPDTAEPLAEGPAKKITRRHVLALAAAGLVKALLGCEGPYKLEGIAKRDGGTDGKADEDVSRLDVEVNDVNVHPDADRPDARPDAMPDSAVPDSGMDSGLHDSGVDAGGPDSALPDSGVDAGADSGTISCPTGTNEELVGWLRSKGVPGTIGTEYQVTYTTYISATRILIDVDCISNAEKIATGRELTLNAETTIDLGGKRLRVTVTTINPNNCVMNAAVETP